VEQMWLQQRQGRRQQKQQVLLLRAVGLGGASRGRLCEKCVCMCAVCAGVVCVVLQAACGVCCATFGVLAAHAQLLQPYVSWLSRLSRHQV
jgi:hypothetical protein